MRVGAGGGLVALEARVEELEASNADISAEVDRYMVFPGQALSYKVGEIKILELRRRAEGKLGPGRFSPAAFHEVVLGSGALPLAALEEKVDAWIEAEAK